jgi:hypothetical protein
LSPVAKAQCINGIPELKPYLTHNDSQTNR